MEKSLIISYIALLLSVISLLFFLMLTKIVKNLQEEIISGLTNLNDILEALSGQDVEEMWYLWKDALLF